jgi:hypothetical protein
MDKIRIEYTQSIYRIVSNQHTIASLSTYKNDDDKFMIKCPVSIIF